MALYSFLKASFIRLLSVQRKDEDGSITGEFKTIPLEDEETRRYGDSAKKLDYFAVSYVWGSLTGHKTIEVNGHALQITPNAHAILNLFCDWPERGKKVWIWIDAVCINQEDRIEKSVQVPLMSSIYSRAKRAVVWLGEGNESTDAGMDLMGMLAMWKNGYPIPRSVFENGEAWAGFRDIAERPWWRRAWTLQESAMPSDIVYYCGSKCLSGDEVRSAVLVANSYNHTQMESPLAKASLAPLWHRRRIYQWLGHQDLDDDFEGYGRRPPRGERKLDDISLLALLAYQRHALASDARDYIYSLLGCAKEKDRQLVGPPNYDSDVRDIYRSFVRSWVMAYGSLDILAFAQLFRQALPSPESGFPSWTPNWAVRLDISAEESNTVPLLVSQPVNRDVGSMLPPRFLREGERRYYHRRGEKLPTYAAAGGMALRVAFSRDMLTVECTGVQIDSIDGSSASSWNDDDEANAIVQSTSAANMPAEAPQSHTKVATDIMLSVYFGRADVYLQYEADERAVLTEMVEALKESTPDNQPFRTWVETNAKLTIRGIPLRDALHQATPTDLPEEAIDEATDEASSRRRSYAISIISGGEDEEKTREDEEAAKHPLSRKFRYATHPSWMGKRLVVTAEGFVGMAPKDACKGDVVCVLFGCSVPMLLRQAAADRYLVVGECYLHGFMEGEALREGYESRNFVLV